MWFKSDNLTKKFFVHLEILFNNIPADTKKSDMDKESYSICSHFFKELAFVCILSLLAARSTVFLLFSF